MARSRWAYFWMLCRRSLHGTKGLLELGEAILATAMYVCLYYVPEAAKLVKGLFVLFLGMLIVSFFFGLFLAAYASNREEQDRRQDAERRLEAEKARLGLHAARRRSIADQLARLTYPQEVAVRAILSLGPIDDNQLGERIGPQAVAGAGLEDLAGRTNLILRDDACRWVVNPSLSDVLRDLLHEQSPSA
jgi:hypothetical protein